MCYGEVRYYFSKWVDFCLPDVTADEKKKKNTCEGPEPYLHHWKKSSIQQHEFQVGPDWFMLVVLDQRSNAILKQNETDSLAQMF